MGCLSGERAPQLHGLVLIFRRWYYPTGTRGDEICNYRWRTYGFWAGSGAYLGFPYSSVLVCTLRLFMVLIALHQQ
jgi:hypothetical protein